MERITKLKSGVLLTGSALLPKGTFVSLNAQKIPVYIFDRRTQKLRMTEAKGPITEVRCSPDVYDSTLEILQIRGAVNDNISG